MGNKDEKTFTDIFSSASEDVATTQTFTDILNGDEVINKQESQTITFDNLFDQAVEYQEDEDQTSLSNQEPTSIATFNPIENKDADSINREAEMTNSTEESPTSNLEFELPNPFFTNEETDTGATSANNMFANSKSIEDEKNTEMDFSINPFINSETYPTHAENATDTRLSEISFEENPFFKDIHNSNINQNLFFDDNPKSFSNSSINISESDQSVTQSTSEQSPIENETSQSTNPFFEEVNNQTNSTSSINILEPNQSATQSTSEQEPIENETFQSTNPFFEEVNNQTNSASSINILEPNQSVTQSTSEQAPIENQPPQSTSPFFEEVNNQTEENPFFQNQINLIENQTPPSSNSNIDTTKSKHYSVKIVKKKEPLIKTILGILSYALFIWLLLVGVTLLVYVLDIKIRAAKGDYSSPTFNAYVVLTGSMLPEIKVNDVVVTKKVDASELEEGDIITFASADSRFQGTIITHRIKKKNYSETEGYTFQTKGDNNNVADNALVPENNIYGKVILKIPKLGYLQEFLAKDGGWIIVILLPCLTVMSYDTVKLIKGIKRKKYKNIKVQK